MSDCCQVDGVAGVDEAGRGPLAGPVVAAAVILGDGATIQGLADSKQLTAARRDYLYGQITEQSRAWAVGMASVAEIDQLNILQATLLAMRRAIEQLAITPDLVRVDGPWVPVTQCKVEAIIGGDRLVPAISAASIVAKVTRDRIMLTYAERYPAYGFEQHKGYGTRQHLQALQRWGATPIHRRSFAPVRRVLTQTADLSGASES